jgi:uncharacterized protein with ParB-like and HNH nuclease domain
VSVIILIIEPEEVQEASLVWMSRLSKKGIQLLYMELKEALSSAMWEAIGREAE